MARVVKLVSDISGAEAEESSFVQLVVREHPNITAARTLDVLPDELDKFKEASNLVVCEVKTAEGETRQLVVTLSDFKKVVPDKVLVNAAYTRGRRRGSTVNGNGSKPDAEPAID